MRAMNIFRTTQCLILYPMKTKKQFTQKFSRFPSKPMMKIYYQLQLYNQLKKLSFTRCVCKKILQLMNLASNSKSSASSLRTNQHSQEKKATRDYPCSLSTLSKHHKCQSAVLSMLTLMHTAITHPQTKMFFNLTSNNWFLLIAQMPLALLSKVMIRSRQFVNKNQSLKVNQT